VAFLLEKDHGVSLPRRLQISLSQEIQKIADESGKEITSTEVWDIFEANYLKPINNFSYIKHTSSSKDEIHSLQLTMNMNDKEIRIEGSGNGPIDSFINGITENMGITIKVADYQQSAISSGSDAKAAAYIVMPMFSVIPLIKESMGPFPEPSILISLSFMFIVSCKE
jgi:2-isopropylmalate synthase